MWRDSMRPIGFFHIDARCLLGFLLLLPAPYPPVLGLGVAIAAFFTICALKGLSAGAALRRVRARLAGRRGAFRPQARRRLLDYGGLPLIFTLALALAPAPASARFRYVAPPAVELAPVETPDPAVAPKAAVPVRLWRAAGGASLIDTLSAWGEEAGATVIALTDRDWRFERGFEIEDDFAGAARRLVAGVKAAPGTAAHVPALRFADGGRLLIVTHRSRIVPEEQP